MSGIQRIFHGRRGIREADLELVPFTVMVAVGRIVADKILITQFMADLVYGTREPCGIMHWVLPSS